MTTKAAIVEIPGVVAPYDHCLCSALVRAGADVELITSVDPDQSAPSDGGYLTSRILNPRSARVENPRLRLAAKAAEVPLDSRRLQRRLREADVAHYQWFGLEELWALALPAKRPRVLTVHDVLPRQPRALQTRAFRRLMSKMDAVIAHTRDAASRLEHEIGLPAERIRLIHPGVMDHLTTLPETRLPAELADSEGPVVLFFGFLKHYKGVDLLIRAFDQVDQGELWIVGRPHMPMEEVEELARRCPRPVRFVSRFVDDRELATIFRRADVVALPYREIDSSGVWFTALAFGTATVATRVGGFGELADEHGTTAVVPPEDPEALGQAIAELLADPAKRERLAAAAREAASTTFSWDVAARRTLELYADVA